MYLQLFLADWWDLARMKIFLYSSSICTSRAPPCILLKYVPFEQLTRAFSIDNNFVHGIEVVNHIGSLVTIEGTKVRIKRECKIECKNSRVGGNLLFSFFLYSSSFFFLLSSVLLYLHIILMFLC